MSDTPPTYIKYMDIAEFHKLGLAQEINRLILHPLGLALEVLLDETGVRLSGVWDFRDDPEGIIFDEGQLDAGRAADIAEAIELRGQVRLANLGYVIQPLPVEGKQLTMRVLEHTVERIGSVGRFNEGEETSD